MQSLRHWLRVCAEVFMAAPTCVIDVLHGGQCWSVAEVLKSERSQAGVSFGGRWPDVNGRLSAAITVWRGDDWPGAGV